MDTLAHECVAIDSLGRHTACRGTAPHPALLASSVGLVNCAAKTMCLPSLPHTLEEFGYCVGHVKRSTALYGRVFGQGLEMIIDHGAHWLEEPRYLLTEMTK